MVKLSDLGELGIIKLLQDFIDDDGLLGRNEDAAAVLVSDDLVAVLNVDGISWTDDVVPQMSDEQVGRKLVSITISDLAAKGCNPCIFLSSLNFPSNWDSSCLMGVARGISIASKDYSMKYMGGDIGSAIDSPVLAGIALGFCAPEQLMSRDRIKPGDPIYCTGHFGITGLAFAHLFNDLDLPEKLKQKVIRRVMEPTPRLREGMVLSQTAAVTGSIDSSDGLAMSLYWLAEASEVGIKLDRLPTDSSVQDFCLVQDIDPFDFVLYGGEELELIVALDQNSHDQACRFLREKQVNLHRIGYATDNVGVIALSGDPARLIEKRGWDCHRGFI